MISEQEFLNFIKMGQVESFKNAIELSPKLALIEDEFGNTPLHYAARFKSLDILEILIDKLDNLNTRNNKDKTALHLISSHGNDDRNSNTTRIIKLMLEKNANPQLQDLAGNTALHLALKGSRSENATLLYSHLLKSCGDECLYISNT